MTSFGFLHLFLAVAICLSSVGTYVQSPAGVTPAPVHVLKIAAGPAGAEANGVYVLTEERTIFSRANDREVVVFFQWDGVGGPHKLVAQWRSPDGGLTSSSAIDYVAKDRRFGAYWRLTLSPTMPLGVWSIEATVDGQPGGRLTFEIKDEEVAAAVVKRPLTQPDLFERLNGLFYVVERSTTAGRKLDAAGGFSAGASRIYTSLAAVDGTDRLFAVAGDGSRRDLTLLLSWHRRQDWAILEGGAAHDVSIPVASPDSTKIGDRIFSIEGGPVGRALNEGAITGQSEMPGTGRRLLATFTNGFGTPGAPVLNEFGELVGMVGGSVAPGASRLIDMLRFRSDFKGVPIVPMTQLRYREDVVPEKLAALQQRGELILALSGEEHVVSGGFAKHVVKGPAVALADQRDEFSSQDKTFITWLNWNPQTRVRGESVWRMFDADNRVIVSSKPAKIDLRQGQLTLTSWQVSVPNVAGIYRVDAMIDERPIWRGFVRISP